MSISNSTRPSRTKQSSPKSTLSQSNHGQPGRGPLPHEQPKVLPNTGFTVICPDDKKRQRILKQAAKEEKAYEEHKRSNRPSHISIAPRRLGGLHDQPTSLEDARKRQQHQVSSSGPFYAAQKARTERRQVAEEEEKRLRLLKEEARKKSERNNGNREAMDSEALRAKRLQFLGL